MIEQTTRYGIATSVRIDHARALELSRQELAKEGFGVLAEIDIAATLKKKLDVDMPPYVILGACNPPLAHRALGAEPDLGLLLPCNVIVRAGGAEDAIVIAAMDPVAALQLTDNPLVSEVAREVRTRLERVLQGVEREARAPLRPASTADAAPDHYDGEHPEMPLAPDHFTSEQRAAARELGDGSPGIDRRHD